MKKKTRILTITGSDSTGGSGMQADIKTITTLGAYATTALTAVTAQDTVGIQHFYDLPAEVLEMQIRSVMNDLRPDAVKVGMLRSVEQVEVVAKLLCEYAPRFVVVDAVVMSSKGDVIVSDAVMEAMVRKIFPLASLVMIKQNCAVHMLHQAVVKNNDDLEAVAQALLAYGSAAVVVQGNGTTTEVLTDVLMERTSTVAVYYSRPSFVDRLIHGVAGAFASAIAVFLCSDCGVGHAIEQAQNYISQLILHSSGSKIADDKQLLDHSRGIAQLHISSRILEIYNKLMNEIAASHRRTSEVAFYAQRLHITPRYLAYITRRIAGRTPKQLIDDYIIKEVETQVLSSSKSIKEIAFDFGFSSPAQFNKFFKKMRHCSPTTYREKYG
ncbi:MAG: hydroxymethylpyrimidine/phosphomethylpyrimidine kinase [Prevotella sp.]|nr:hydroxymethylpyrimidine/phosphomethylpyrimidine kinase [Prevotella sp.]